jgi:hypothetical protein
VTTATVAGPVVETVSRKRVIPPAELARETTSNAAPEFWDYIESLTPEQWSDHIVYLYREDPKASNYGNMPAYLDKFVGFIEVRPGYQIPMDDRGNIEAAIREKFGGRAFRLICKKGKERITEGKCVNEAPPKLPDANAQYATANPLPNAAAHQSDANAIASKAIDTVANQPQEVMNIAINALRASAELIAKSATPPAPNPTQSLDSELDKAFKAAMIQKLLAPPPDPVETFLRIKTALGDGGGANPLVDRLLTAAVDRFMTPPVVTAPGRSTMIDLGREALSVLPNVVDRAMTNWRLGIEAQRDAIAMQRGMNPQPGTSPGPQPQPGAPAPVIEMPTRTAEPQANPGEPPAVVNVQPPLEYIETVLVRILKDKDLTVEEAVDETLSFLYWGYPEMVGLLLDPPKLDQRLAPGEQGILQLFQNRPTLMPMMTNLPRLTEFIRKFIAAAKESEASRAGGPAPAPASAPPPA